MTKRILVALSGTPYTPTAVRYAIELAAKHKAEVTGVTVTDIRRLANVGPMPVGAGTAGHDLAEHRIHVTEERIEDNVRSFEDNCRNAGLSHCVERESGDPLEELLSVWRYHDLTIFGLRGLFEYGVVHNPDDMLIKLISHGVRPILAVSREHRDIRRVLITYNGSMESAKAMKRFVQMQLWSDITAKVVCFDRKPEAGNQLLRDAASYCRAHGLQVETELVAAKPRDHLLEHAEQWNADLIVMGSSNRLRIFKHVLGDTVLMAIRESEIPLFLTQ